jgi:hypothetical protein
MVGYVLLGARAWTLTAKTKGVATTQPLPKATLENLDFFRYELHCWQQRLDPAVHFDADAIEKDDAFFTVQTGKSAVYLKTLLYLRSNQIQILVLRPVLMRKQSLRNELALAREAVCLAKQSIRALRLLATSTDLYHPRRAVFNHFLGSALAVLFLAATHDAEHRNHASGIGINDSLLESGEELGIGLELAKEVRATKLAHYFERPNRQLIRMGMLKPAGTRDQHLSGLKMDGSLGVTSLESAADMDMLLDSSFDFALDGYYPDDGLLNLDWINDLLH